MRACVSSSRARRRRRARSSSLDRSLDRSIDRARDVHRTSHHSELEPPPSLGRSLRPPPLCASPGLGLCSNASPFARALRGRGRATRRERTDAVHLNEFDILRSIALNFVFIHRTDDGEARGERRSTRSRSDDGFEFCDSSFPCGSDFGIETST